MLDFNFDNFTWGDLKTLANLASGSQSNLTSFATFTAMIEKAGVDLDTVPLTDMKDLVTEFTKALWAHLSPGDFILRGATTLVTGNDT